MNIESDSWHWAILQGAETPARVAALRQGSPVTFYPESVASLMDAVRASILGNTEKDEAFEPHVAEKTMVFDIESHPPGSVAFKIVDADPVILYVLMRNDLKSMTAGRAAAHAAHAANQMVYHLREIGDAAFDDTYERMLQEWEEQADGFGTTIVLAADIDCIRETVKAAMGCAKADPIAAGIVHDPTYPLRDGEITHLIALDTCGFVFARRSVAKPFVGDLPLL